MADIIKNIVANDGFDLTQEDITAQETSRVQEEESRTQLVSWDRSSLLGRPGILANEATSGSLVVTGFGSDGKVTISAGSAYNGEGRLIYLSSTKTYSGVNNSPADDGKFICARYQYSAVTKDSRAHPITGVTSPTREYYKDDAVDAGVASLLHTATWPPPAPGAGSTESSIFYISTVLPSSPDIVIGRIQTAAGGAVTMYPKSELRYAPRELLSAKAKFFDTALPSKSFPNTTISPVVGTSFVVSVVDTFGGRDRVTTTTGGLGSAGTLDNYTAVFHTLGGAVRRKIQQHVDDTHLIFYTSPVDSVEGYLSWSSVELSSASTFFVYPEATPSVTLGADLERFLACQGTSSLGRTLTNPMALHARDIEGFGAKLYDVIVPTEFTDIQDAIDFVTNNSSLKTVFIERGTYALSAPLVLKPNVRLLGVNRDGVVIVSSATDAITVDVTVTSAMPVVLESLTVEATNSSSASYPFSATNATGLYLLHCNFIGGSYADAHGVVLQDCNSVYVKDCEFTKASSPSSYGIYIKQNTVPIDQSTFMVSECDLFWSGGAGANALYQGGGISLTTDAAAGFGDVTLGVEGCNILGADISGTYYGSGVFTDGGTANLPLQVVVKRTTVRRYNSGIRVFRGSVLSCFSSTIYDVKSGVVFGDAITDGGVTLWGAGGGLIYGSYLASDVSTGGNGYALQILGGLASATSSYRIVESSLYGYSTTGVRNGGFNIHLSASTSPGDYGAMVAEFTNSSMISVATAGGVGVGGSGCRVENESTYTPTPCAVRIRGCVMSTSGCSYVLAVYNFANNITKSLALDIDTSLLYTVSATGIPLHSYAVILYLSRTPTLSPILGGVRNSTVWNNIIGGDACSIAIEALGAMSSGFSGLITCQNSVLFPGTSEEIWDPTYIKVINCSGDDSFGTLGGFGTEGSQSVRYNLRTVCGTAVLPTVGSPTYVAVNLSNPFTSAFSYIVTATWGGGYGDTGQKELLVTRWFGHTFWIVNGATPSAVSSDSTLFWTAIGY